MHDATAKKSDLAANSNAAAFFENDSSGETARGRVDRIPQDLEMTREPGSFGRDIEEGAEKSFGDVVKGASGQVRKNKAKGPAVVNKNCIATDV